MHIGTDPRTSDGHDDGLAVLLVEVDGVRCGIPAANVTELHPMVATVALPGAPAVIDGAIDVRGSVVAVLDVRGRLGLTRRPPLLSDHLVVCRVGERSVALRVDRALELVSVPRPRFVPSEPGLTPPGRGTPTWVALVTRTMLRSAPPMERSSSGHSSAPRTSSTGLSSR